VSVWTGPDTPMITNQMAHDLALEQKVCVRPLLRRVYDRQTGTEDVVAIPCGSTREAACPSCAYKARVLRMQQCTEGWHRTTEPDRPDPSGVEDDDQVDDAEHDSGRRVRSTRRRQDAPDLPRVPMHNRTVGEVFRSAEGREYRPSMFLTFTLPSYGPVTDTGAPQDPGSYDYRRAALDALHFPKLVDRLWQNIRRAAGYRVQYFAAIEAQRRLAPHLHAAMRGVITRQLLRQVVAGTYVQLWWPSFDQAVYVDRLPVWTGECYVDADTGELLPTWEEALDQLDTDPEARPAHVLRFGVQLDAKGLIAPSENADRAVRYLTKYLAKNISDTYTDQDDAAYQAHIDRLHEEVRWLPCTPGCANWLRYGIQPANPGPGLIPGRCANKAHDRENLGLGGRRVLVSRQWSGKTLSEHKADRATVVREALTSAGIDAPELDRMAASITLPDGSPRFVWTDTRPDADIYARVILASVLERQQWRTLYQAAKACQVPVDSLSATNRPP
jgi:Replication initiator protein, pSAM2